jgi:ERCC4-related helicase
LAIRCLDEGVNIPCISHGIILSSTTNPREFIQRRGRLLRQYTGKPYSRIFDAFALPSNDPGESGFILSGILRARELAEESLNWDANKRRIDRIIEQYGITINSDLEEEIRENEEEE